MKPMDAETAQQAVDTYNSGAAAAPSLFSIADPDDYGDEEAPPQV
jgi:hypothetical protein